MHFVYNFSQHFFKIFQHFEVKRFGILEQIFHDMIHL